MNKFIKAVLTSILIGVIATGAFNLSIQSVEFWVFIIGCNAIGAIERE